MQRFNVLAPGTVLAILCIGPHVASGQETEPASEESRPATSTKTISISGICRDENQEPLAGVKISVWKMPRATRGERIVDVSSGDDGRFHVDDLPAPPGVASLLGWTYTLVATHPGCESQVRTLRAPAGTEQILDMHPSATLKGRVFTPDNRPLARAIVWSDAADETMTLFGIRSTKTDDEGRFSIADVRGEEGVPVRGSVLVLHPDFAQQRVSYPFDPGFLGIRLREGSTISGRVVDGETGGAVAGVVVVANHNSPADRVKFPLEELNDLRETLTDEQGKYRITGVGANARYSLKVISDDRVPTSNGSILTTPGETDTLPDLTLVQGALIEGRVLTLKGEPLSHDPQFGKRLIVTALQNPVRFVEVDDDGRFRLRVTPGKHRVQIHAPHVWERTWRRAAFENGIEFTNGQTVAVTFRVGDKAPPKPRPERADGGKVPLPDPVPEERWAAKEIRELGGWYQLDADKHVVEVNMVYAEHEGKRYDNPYTDSDEALRAARAFPRLERLLLHKAQATDEAMTSVEGLKELRWFFVWDAVKLTDAGVKHLAGLKRLENVHLSNGGLGDGTLEVLSTLPNLKAMSLQGNAFTNEGLAHLVGMEQLESLWVGLGKGEITDAGLVHLEGLTNLKTLDLQRTGVTEKGLDELKKALPGVRAFK